MKVVINSCYGGFSLSQKAVARLAELNGKKAYFFKLKVRNEEYEPIEIGQDCGLFWTAFSIPNPNEFFANDKDWHDMAMDERKAQNEKHASVGLETRPENRADPLLVQVVEELGGEADGDCAKLKIVEIPDGIKWHISEYDGIEHIAEDHETWS